MLLLMGCLSGIVSCQKKSDLKVVESPITVKGCGDAFVAEHDDLFAENIRLKQALKICREQH